MNHKHICSLICTVLLCAFITSCSSNTSSDTYSTSEMSAANKVVSGVVIAKRPVKVDGNSGMGGVAGVLAGAGAGSAIGGSSAANIVGAVGGAVIGGLAGNAVDKKVNSEKGYEYIVREKGGSTISVVQVDTTQFEINQRVLVIYGKRTRLISDTTVAG